MKNDQNLIAEAYNRIYLKVDEEFRDQMPSSAEVYEPEAERKEAQADVKKYDVSQAGKDILWQKFLSVPKQTGKSKIAIEKHKLDDSIYRVVAGAYLDAVDATKHRKEGSYDPNIVNEYFDKALREIKKYYITSPEQEVKLKDAWLHWYGSEKARRESFFPKHK
jgi:hypothetical protein